jgi:hypothetical protein
MVAASVSNMPKGSNQHKAKVADKEGLQICTSSSEGVTIDEAAEALSVLQRTLQKR